MTREEKELLLKDLCARLPYNTKIQLIEYSDWTGKKLPSKIKILDYLMLELYQACCKGFRKDEIKPYLFPLSSMTEEQKEEFDNVIGLTLEDLESDEQFSCKGIVAEIDFYHKHHFDYRGLIEKGLAIDATGKNIY
jgi:hypothetical protein